MGTKERLNILKEKFDDEMKFKCRVFKDEDIRKEGNIWYIPEQDGSVKAVKVEPMKTKEDVIIELLKRISDLEFEVEKLEKNEQYKYINGQAYFRQDYVLGREKEIDRLNKRIDKAIEYIENHSYHDSPSILKNGLYEQGDLIPKCDFYSDDLLSILKGEDKE